MSSTRIIVKWLILQQIATVCLAGLMIEIPTLEDSSDLIKPLVTIIKNCYKGQSDAIGIGGRSIDSLISSLSAESDRSVILIDNTKRTFNSFEKTGWNLHKLQMFVVTTTSPLELRSLLTDMRETRWWNSRATFYIINWPMNKNGCSAAFQYLFVAWKMNLLRAKFICNDNGTEPMIYGFNPYTSQAPAPWKLEKVHSGDDNHPWALLVRKYVDSPDICDDMDFDTTKDLGGYVIRVEGVSVAKKLMGDMIVPMLNGTPKLLKQGFDTCDIAFGKPADLTGGYYEVMEPHYYTGFKVITQYAGDKSQLGKLISVIDRSSRIGVSLVFLATVVFLKFVQRQTPMTAFLNTARMFCNSCLAKVPIDAPTRIYLTGLFFFAITILGIYQSQLASLLAKRVLLPDIETVGDLAESQHTIYVYRGFASVFSSEVYDRRLRVINSYICTEHVRQDSSAACGLPSSVAIVMAERYKLHVMSDSLFPGYYSFVCRKDWPLAQKFTIWPRRLYDGANVRQVYDKHLEHLLLKIEQTKTEGTDLTRKILGITDLGFAFTFLGIGLALASLCFIAENIFERVLRSRIANLRRRFCPRLRC